MADDAHNSITVNYQYEKNAYSDSQFLKDYIEQQPDNDSSATFTADGGYCRMGNSRLAEGKNITLVTTDLREPRSVITGLILNSTKTVQNC